MPRVSSFVPVGNSPALRVWLPCVAALVLSVAACGSTATEQPAAASGAAGAAQGGSASGNGGSSSGAAGTTNAHGGNGQSGSGGASGGAGGTSSVAGKGGAGAAGAGGVGGGAATVPPCPGTAPVSAARCGSNSQVCFYEDCAGAGRSVATCTNGSWSVEVGACAAVQCAYPVSMSCVSGQICSVTAGGALLARCVENGCGKGAITCACASSCSSCSIAGSVSQGVTVSCNSCASATCA